MYEKMTAAEAAQALRTDAAVGLSPEEASARLARDGLNEIAEKKRKSVLMVFLAQLHDPMIYILFAAALISIWHREVGDALIILAVVLLNAIIGTTQELKAEAALEALKKMSSPFALARRGGRAVEIPAKELVVGDIVILDAGRIIPADLRLTSTINLKIDESALTGESVPVEKDAGFIAGEGAGVGDRLNMAYSSTSVTYGRGEGIVIGTAMNTEIGKIAAILNEGDTDRTPLQKRLADLSKLLGAAAVVICVAMLAIALLQGREFSEMMLTAISLAVAAVPEGLLAVVTIVLALGVRRLVKVNTIVRRLPSVETLGAVSVVCSDKTGTLTQNKMTVEQIYRDGVLENVSNLDKDKDRAFLEGFVLCNDASVAGGSRTGDPTELALLDMGGKLGLSREGMEETLPRVDERAFDSNRKLMTTVHQRPGADVRPEARVSYTKGAMDNILEASESILTGGEVRPITAEDKAKITDAAGQMARGALRVLGLALKAGGGTDERGLTFVGLVGMIDPPRPEAASAVETLRGAGIRTVMITGDHKDTALAIAKQLGIAQSDVQCITGGQLAEMTQEELNAKVNDLRVFARVSPEHKVMIVRALKSHGYIVSMTGDGVNDAPSLQAADIGVAMGITGTDVAKGASDMVLTDDNFATIEKAVEEGRNIYNNIKKTVLFLLSSNFGEVITMFTAIASGIAAPLRATHILWVNLVTDGLPGLALGVDTESGTVMNRPPRKAEESLFAHGGLALTLFYGFVVATITLSAFLIVPVEKVGLDFAAIKLYLENPENLKLCQTFAFTTLATCQLFHAFGMRNTGKSIFTVNQLTNKTMVFAFFFGMFLQIAVTEIPFLANLFDVAEMSAGQWLRIILLSTTPLIFHEIFVLVNMLRRSGRRA
jgi:Ca2+-transporting ATPase